MAEITQAYIFHTDCVRSEVENVFGKDKSTMFFTIDGVTHEIPVEAFKNFIHKAEIAMYGESLIEIVEELENEIEDKQAVIDDLSSNLEEMSTVKETKADSRYDDFATEMMMRG